MLNDDCWREHALETVFWGHHPWVSYLLNAGVIQEWLESADEQEVNRALWLLRSVAEHLPDQVTDTLTPFVDKGGDWPQRTLTAICWKEVDDSERMFELRLQLAGMGHVKDFVDWQSLCAQFPLCAIRLIEAVLSTWTIDDEKSSGRKGRLERWYSEDVKALNSAVKQCPARTWDLLMPHIERLTSIRATDYDPRLQKWRDELFERHETNIARGVVDLLILAGKTLALKQPDELAARTGPLENSFSPVVQEIIVASYALLPAGHADTGIAS